MVVDADLGTVTEASRTFINHRGTQQEPPYADAAAMHLIGHNKRIRTSDADPAKDVPHPGMADARYMAGRMARRREPSRGGHTNAEEKVTLRNRKMTQCVSELACLLDKPNARTLAQHARRIWHSTATEAFRQIRPFS
jgi:hypothetical protein